MSLPYLSDVVKASTGYDLPLPLPMFDLLVACAAASAAACLRAESGRMGQDKRIGNAKYPIKAPDGTLPGTEVPAQEIGVRATQAELIAIGLTTAGLAGLAVSSRRPHGMAPRSPSGAGSLADESSVQNQAFTTTPAPCACSSAWYELRTIAPTAACTKPILYASASNILKTSGWT
jgi:hypothetical protein